MSGNQNGERLATLERVVSELFHRLRAFPGRERLTDIQRETVDEYIRLLGAVTPL